MGQPCALTERTASLLSCPTFPRMAGEGLCVDQTHAIQSVAPPLSAPLDLGEVMSSNDLSGVEAQVHAYQARLN